jgi:hypothetical protein
VPIILKALFVNPPGATPTPTFGAPPPTGTPTSVARALASRQEKAGLRGP